jgi:flagellar biosynthesis/type III secretory pathway protein FliH
VRILDDSPSTSGESKKCDAGQTPVQDLQADKTGFSKACQALNGVVAKLNQLYDTLFAGHREEITKLSVEIARKILMQKVQNGDYEIESIVQEALKNAPTHEDVVVHLNPEDLAGLQKVQQDDASSFAGIKFVADPNIGRAECRLESPKGIIESSINEHLERIGKALTDSQKQ